MSPRRESNVSGIQPSSSVNYGSLEPETPSEEQQKTKSHHTRINVSDLKNLTTKQVQHKYIDSNSNVINGILCLFFPFRQSKRPFYFITGPNGSSILSGYSWNCILSK